MFQLSAVPLNIVQPFLRQGWLTVGYVTKWGDAQWRSMAAELPNNPVVCSMMENRGWGSALYAAVGRHQKSC